MRRLENKIILMAGAGSIGNECARRYASEGASVVLGDIREDIAQGAVDEIRRAGGKAVAVKLDGGDEASIKRAVEVACETYGGLDGLHANFACVIEGIGGTSVIDLPMEMYDQIMQVNARGFFLCTRYALPPMLARGGGSIVYTTSGAATKGEDTRVAYAMSKTAAQALARHVAIKFGPQGVRANSVAPGVIERQATAGREASPASVREIATKFTSIKRLGQPTDIASMCTLLMSDEGSYITGQVLNIDGGVTMRP
jgi:NAD(P)-dependent dehydrogenase (short-subunit alcohol dehydrogenase family)